MIRTDSSTPRNRLPIAVLVTVFAAVITSHSGWAACPDFAPAVSYAAGSHPIAVAAGDLNGDGKGDLAVIDSSSDAVSILLGNGDGTFAAAAAYATGSFPSSVAVGDFNGDGKGDLAVANVLDDKLSILLGHGDGTFAAAVPYSIAIGSTSVAIGDFNGDGKDDLVVASKSANSVSILLGNGDGTFATAVAYTAGSSPSSVAVGDFNRDGKSDFAVANSNSKKVSILLGNGDGTFAAAVAYAAGNGPSSVAVGDFNRDGKGDLAVTNDSSDNVSILLGNGDGTFAAAVAYATGSSPLSVAVGDFDGDGKSDLAVANLNDDNVSILSGNGDGTFAAAANYAAGSASRAVVVGDFDGDGKSDLAVANLNDDNVSVLLGSGVCSLNCGTFAAAVNYAAGSGPQSVVVGDFNRDGTGDLAVVNQGSNTVSILLGNGDGTFAAAVNDATGNVPTSVAVGDFNGDGKVDLAITNASNTVSILLGNGDGTFAAAVNYGVGTGPTSVAVGDLNGDGKADLAVANEFSGNVSILLGNGDGTFAAAVNYAAANGPLSVALGDFNSDGKGDLAVANFSDNIVSILLGNGDGTFAAAVNYGAGSGPASVAVGDFNGDGKGDLAVAENASDTASILLGNGDGTFAAAVNYGVGIGPTSVALGDFDGDGKADLAVANFDSNDVSILLNTCPPPDLTISKTHIGSFAQGQTGVTYTITATNAGTGPTIGTVTVTDALPTGLTATAISGTGWACTLGTLTCTRSDALAASASYPDITLTVDVAVDAPASVTNTATVSGTELDPANDTASDPTAVTQVQDLTVTKTHIGSFTQGDTGKAYTISVKNSGVLPTNGTVTVTDALPASLTATAMSGTGWTCTLGTLTCIRNDVLAGGGIWSPIVLTVDVAGDAPFTVTNVVNVSGGGEVNSGNSSASDPTVIHSAMNCGVFAPNGNYATGNGPDSVAAGDLNDDGKGDLAVVNFGDNTVSILLGNGDGTFAAAVSYAVGGEPGSVAIGDFNNDGKGDLAVPAFSSNDVSILLGNGDGTFAAAVSYGAGAHPFSVAVGDFDGDGNGDLAVANLASADVSILLGNGDGTFAAAVNYGVGSQPGSVAIGDFNSDGKSDLAVANVNDNTVSMLLGNGDGTFAAAVNYPTGQSPNSIAVADFNGDGNGDLATANLTDDDVSILLGNGDGTFAAAVNYAAGTEPDSVVIGDFNGDGNGDLAVSNDGGGNVSILMGNGDGTFAAAVNYGAGSRPLSVAIDDFNGDGKGDLAVANFASDNVLILLGNGCPDLTISKTHAGDFTEGQSSAVYTLSAGNAGTGATSGLVTVTDTLPASLTATSIGGSGWSCTLGTLTCTRSDALAGEGSYPDITLTVDVSPSAPPSVTNTAAVSGGGEVFTTNDSASDPTTIVEVSDLTITKTHIDGFMQGDTGKSYTLAVTNIGGLATSGTVTVTDALPAGLTATEISGTGWACTLGTLTCTRNDVLGSGASYPDITLTVDVETSAPRSITNTATVSGGGEVFTANDTASDPTTVTQFQDLTITKMHIGSFTQGDTGKSYTISVKNSGDLPTSGTVTVTDALPASLTATAMSGTGWTCTLGTLTCIRNDALAGGGIWPPIVLTVEVAGDAPFTVTNVVNVSGGAELNTGNDSASDPTVIHGALNCGVFPPKVDFAAGNGPVSVATGDFNGDGKGDLALADVDSNNVSILLGNGDGTFAAAASYGVGLEPNAVAIGDFDGNGKSDLAVANFSSDSVSVLLGNGDGTFAAAMSYPAGSGPFSVVVGDFNGDGTGDLAIPNSGSNDVSILLGNGDGTFATAVSYPAGNLPREAAVADLNGDGKSDLAVANLNVNNVSILLGNGDGTFASAVNYGTGSFPTAVAVGDFNDDGKGDLAVANLAGHNVSILLGNGDGTFTARVNYATGTLPSAVAIGDFNGDGKGDLAVANHDSNNVSILLGNGDGTFAAAVDYGAGNGPTSVAIGDFDGDGKGDLAVANDIGDNVSILLGNGCPDLTISKTHSGDLTQGQSGASYTLATGNAGNATTTGLVTVTDTLPPSLTATSIAGSGWSCTLGTLTCTRSDALAGRSSFPDIILTVDVSTAAPPSVTNTAAISGGGEVLTTNDSANDPTTVVQMPDLTIAKTHSGNFAQGQSGRTYSIIVQNAGFAPTSATVTVTDTLPAGLTVTDMAGPGWSCNPALLTCTRIDPLAASASYPAITLTVDVSTNAPASIINTAGVSGGGEIFTANDTASDPTTILTAPEDFSAVAISTSQVSATWSAVAGATNYQLFRSSNNGPFVLVGFPNTNNFVDTGLTPNTTYLYYVRATDASNIGLPSNTDLATTILFTDDPLVPGSTIIKAVHVSELRTAVDAVRAAAGLPPATFADKVTVGTFIEAAHIIELRSILDEARLSLGLPAIVYSDPALTAGYTVKAAHIRELRAGMK